MRAKQILSRGFGGSALTLLTGGYYPATTESAFDDTAVVIGVVVGPSASGAVFGPSASGGIDAPSIYGTAIGPQTSGAVEGPSETWH